MDWFSWIKDFAFDKDRDASGCRGYPCVQFFRLYSKFMHHPHFNGYYTAHFGQISLLDLKLLSARWYCLRVDDERRKGSPIYKHTSRPIYIHKR